MSQDHVKGATIAAQLYVGAALDDVEQRLIREVQEAVAAARRTFLADLEGDHPFQHLIKLAASQGTD